MAPKNRNPRERRSSQGPELSSGASESVDLLEVGPDDGEDLLEFQEAGALRAKIKVIGVGGAGGNALDTMIRAKLGGVEIGDIIRAVEGRRMAPAADLSDVLLPHRPGERIQVEVLRRGEPLNLEVVLGRAD